MSDVKEGKTKGKANFGAVIILIISAAVFIPAGGFAVIQGLRAKTPVFGTVNGQKITYEPGSRFYQIATNTARQYQQYGISINDRMYSSIIRNAYDQTVIEYYYKDAVEKSGYSVPQEAVNRQLVDIFTEDGVFNKKKYNQQPDTVINGLRKEIEENLYTRRFLDDSFGSVTKTGDKSVYGLKYSEAEKALLASFDDEKHAFELAVFNTDSYPDEEVKAFASSHSDKFMKYDLLAITVNTNDEAASLLKQINEGSLSFEDARADNSLNYFTDSDGNLTSPFAYQIEALIEGDDKADILASVTSLKKDEVSSVVKTSYGFDTVYTIFKGNGDASAADTSVEADLKAVRNYITGNENSIIETYFLNLGQDLVDDYSVSNSFEKACKKFNLEKEDVKAFALNYGNTRFADSVEGTLQNAASNKEILTKLFSLKENEASEPFVLGDHIVVARCTKIASEPDVPKVAESEEESEPEDPLKTAASKIASSDDDAANDFIQKSSSYKDSYYEAYSKVFSPASL